MKYINISGVEYACKEIATLQNAIEFTPEEFKIEHAVEAFSDASELAVLDEEKNKEGIYKGLTFRSATVEADGTVKVTLTMETDTEQRLKTLEKGQAECEEAIAELIGGNEDE